MSAEGTLRMSFAPLVDPLGETLSVMWDRAHEVGFPVLCLSVDPLRGEVVAHAPVAETLRPRMWETEVTEPPGRYEDNDRITVLRETAMGGTPDREVDCGWCRPARLCLDPDRVRWEYMEDADGEPLPDTLALYFPGDSAVVEVDQELARHAATIIEGWWEDRRVLEAGR